jgi:hypothetical protein
MNDKLLVIEGKNYTFPYSTPNPDTISIFDITDMESLLYVYKCAWYHYSPIFIMFGIIGAVGGFLITKKLVKRYESRK